MAHSIKTATFLAATPVHRSMLSLPAMVYTTNPTITPAVTAIKAVAASTRQSFFRRPTRRTHPSSRAFLLPAEASGASPARMKPWPAPS